MPGISHSQTPVVAKYVFKLNKTVMANGAVSDWSNEVCKTVVGKKPNPPVLVIK
jgi:hypothetical protein